MTPSFTATARIALTSKHLVFCTWGIPVTDLYGKYARIPFYICEGEGLHLLGNSILHPSIYSGQRNLLTIPPHVGGIYYHSLTLPVANYGDNTVLRKYLNIIPSLVSSITSYFSAGSGLPQPFVLKRDGRIVLLLTKVVEDILITGSK